MRYTLRQLEIFLATAKHQNITAAAQELCMSQSAASAALGQLEKQYEITLFERTGKSLTLSQAGRALRNRAQQLMDNALGFDAELAGMSQTGQLNVGASLTIGNYLGVRYFSEYLSNYPETQSDFVIANSPEILRKVLNNELDVGLVEYEENHPDLRFELWRRDELKIFCSPTHAFAQKDTLSTSDLLEARWILREANSGTRQTFDRAMQGLLPRLNIFLELEHNEAIKRAVEANIGLGCLSDVALSSNLKNGDLIALDVKDRPLNRYFYFVFNRHRKPTLAVERWLDLCREAIND